MAVDWDAWERIMKYPGKIEYIPSRMMAHRIHEDSETTNNTLDKNREKEEYLMFRKYWGERMTKLLMKVYVVRYSRTTDKITKSIYSSLVIFIFV